MDTHDSASPPPGDHGPGEALREAPHPGTLPRAVRLRSRHDGWTPDRQHDFITALAETGCVTEAAAAVKMTARSAYRLRARADANIFRQAWDIALDYAIRNLTDVAMSRAINGVARPVFYKGEQVGERRYYNERLTQFLLRYRDPVRYGAWRDGYEARRHPDGAGIVLANALNILMDAGHGVDPPVDRDGIERPLEEGPAPTAEAEVKVDLDSNYPDDDPEMRDLRNAFRNLGKPEVDPHGDEADWLDPLTTLRPAIASKFKVP